MALRTRRSGPVILVTGGAGYIGSHFAHYMRDLGESVVVVDRLLPGLGRRELVPEDVPLIVGDVKDGRFLRKEVFGRWHVEAVVHFAARALVGESVAQPHLYYGGNTTATQVLLDEMLEARVTSLVCSSTCAVYGIPEYCPLDEGHPTHPITPYGQSKLFCERMIEHYAAAYDLRYMALRYFNVAGADPEGRTGEWHDPETHLIPSALAVAAGRKQALEVCGGGYPTADGSAIRDYVDVNDLVRAHALALDYLRREKHSGTFNLGSGRQYTVRQVVQRCAAVTGLPIPVVMKPARSGDPAVLVADVERARRELGWQPQSSLDSMILSAWMWEQARERLEVAARERGIVHATGAHFA